MFNKPRACLQAPTVKYDRMGYFPNKRFASNAFKY